MCQFRSCSYREEKKSKGEWHTFQRANKRKPDMKAEMC